MTPIECSNEFDVLVNNINDNAAPGFTQYEKSIFLNKALEELFDAVFNPKNNKQIEGFSLSLGDTKRILLHNYQKFASIDVDSASEARSINGVTCTLVDQEGRKVYALIKEVANSESGPKPVFEINTNDFLTLISKPYPHPHKGYVVKTTIGDNKFEYVAPAGFDIVSITFEYIIRPLPIMLNDTETDLSIDGVFGSAEGTMGDIDESLHHAIVQRAVELAKLTYHSNNLEYLQGLPYSNTIVAQMAQQAIAAGNKQ